MCQPKNMLDKFLYPNSGELSRQYSNYEKWENIETKKKKVTVEKKLNVTVEKKLKVKVEKKKVDRMRYRDRCIDISVKYCSYFEQDYNRVMEVEKKMIDKEKKMIDKEKNMIELYEKTYEKIDVGFCLLLNTSLSKDVIEIIREYVYTQCEECHYIDVEDKNLVKTMNQVFCEDCVRLFVCICGRKFGYNGRCCYCDYIVTIRRMLSR